MEVRIKKRNENLDIAKGLGIIAVVFGHSGAPFANFFTLYHLSLFFFISGFLYKDAYTADPWALLKNRIRTLYVPFVKYGLFFGVLHNLLFKLHIYTDQIQAQYNQVVYFNSTREFVVNLVKIASFVKVEQILAPLWFLPVLFIVNVLFVLCTCSIHKLTVRKPDAWLALAISALFFTGFFFYPAHKHFVLRPVSIAMVALVMYYFGFLYKRHEGLIGFNLKYAALCLLILLIGYPYGPIEPGGHKFGSPHFYVAVSLCGIYLNLYIARWLAERQIVLKKFLLLAGRNTIGIMALHFLAFRAVNFVQVQLYNLPPYMTGQHPFLFTSHGWWLLYLLAGVMLPIAGSVVYERIKGYFRTERQPSPI